LIAYALRLYLACNVSCAGDALDVLSDDYGKKFQENDQNSQCPAAGADRFCRHAHFGLGEPPNLAPVATAANIVTWTSPIQFGMKCGLSFLQ
jgi:hypothetical protein